MMTTILPRDLIGAHGNHRFLWRQSLLILLLTCLCWIGTAQAQLQTGHPAPHFTTAAAFAGQSFEFDLQKALTQGPVVVYFYPKAFTAGSTIEAQLFAEHANHFKEFNASVVGVSGDDIETLKRFSGGPCGGKFAVASDPDRSIMQAYQASRRIQSGMADRISYVITPEARILAVFAGISPAAHVESTLKALEQWH